MLATDPSATELALLGEVTQRLRRLVEPAAHESIADAADLIAEALKAGGVIQAFGTGHSEAFSMEIAGRAGGLIPTTRIALRDLVLFGNHELDVISDGKVERDPAIVDELWNTAPVDPRDIFLIASNSGVNGSIVGMALKVKEHGHRLIAVTSLEHTNAVTPKHPSGKRLSEIADVVIDNLAPYGDSTLTVAAPPDAAAEGAAARSVAIRVGAVSSMTAAFIAQLLTVSVTERLAAAGVTPPIYLSANIPGGDEHNHVLEDRYAGRIRRGA